MKTIIVTGSAGLIGAEAVRFFGREGSRVGGIANDMRKYFLARELQLNGAAANWPRTAGL